MNTKQIVKFCGASIFMIVANMITSVGALWVFSDIMHYEAWLVMLIYNIIWGLTFKLFGGYSIMKFYVFNEARKERAPPT